MDDDSGWNQILLELWSAELCDAVVERIERAAVGRHGWLARVFADPDHVRESLTEIVHALILAGIQDETGADLDGLGSQSAWECYEQVWAELADRWADGGPLPAVPIGNEPDVVRALAELPVEAAVAAGADVTEEGTIEPLWLHGRLRVDEHGLEAYLRIDGEVAPSAVRRHADRILARLT